MEAGTTPERQRARALAEEYRSRGYEVIEEPSPARLPDFLAGYRPDLFVRKGDEAIKDDILRRLEAAAKLLESGFPEAALLLAWSTSEATLRLLIETEGIVLDHLNPPYILKQAVMHGVIAGDEYNFLTNVIKYRNALVHGFKTLDFDPALVSELISRTKRLVQSTTAQQST